MNKAKNDSIFNLTLRLVIITVCAGLILGLVYGIAKGPDRAADQEKATEARQMVLPDATDFKQIALDGIGYDREKIFRYTGKFMKERQTDRQSAIRFRSSPRGYKPGFRLR